MNVKIIRVLNTNAVVSVDSQGMELIMTGPGIGFKKRKGENIDQSLVDKTYHLENKEESKRLQEVVKEISEEYLGIVDRVVKEAKKEKLEIRDSLYVTLTYQFSSRSLSRRNRIKEYDEAAFIAMHIVSAELNAQNITDVNQITELINTVLQIIRIHFKIDLNEESISYERFLTHLKFFAARVFDHMEYEDTMQEIYKVMVEQNENAFSGVKKIAEYIKKQYNYKLTIDEQLYLLIHIKRILDEQTK